MSCPYTLTLSTPGLSSVTIGDGGDFGLRSLDLGFPEVRQEAYPAPAADGTIDQTQYFGRRLITADIVLSPGTWAREQALRAFLSPQFRSSMAIEPDDETKLVTTVRGAAMSAPVTIEDLGANVRRMQAQWVAPLGILESFDQRSAISYAAGSVSAAGRTYDLTFNRDYPDAPPAGSVVVTSAGTANAYPILRVYGPCTGPVLEHTDLGRMMDFPALTIAAGDFLEIDTRAKTIRYNGNADDSRYGELDFATSAWFWLTPGTQRIRFVPDTFTTPSQVQITWRDAWV